MFSNQILLQKTSFTITVAKWCAFIR